MSPTSSRRSPLWLLLSCVALLFARALAGESTTLDRAIFSDTTSLALWVVDPLSQLSPAFAHALVLAAHLACMVAVQRLLARRLDGAQLAATLGALLFAVHPGSADAVAFLAGSAPVWTSLFALVAILLARKQPLAAAACAALASASGNVAWSVLVPLAFEGEPALLPIGSGLLAGSLVSVAVLHAAPLPVGVIAIACLFAAFAVRRGRLLVSTSSWVSDLAWFAAPALVLALDGALSRDAEMTPAYLPWLGAAALVARGVATAGEDRARRAITFGSVGIASAALAALAFVQAGRFADDDTFWTAAVDHAPRSATAHIELARVRWDAGRQADARSFAAGAIGLTQDPAQQAAAACVWLGASLDLAQDDTAQATGMYDALDLLARAEPHPGPVGALAGTMGAEARERLQHSVALEALRGIAAQQALDVDGAKARLTAALTAAPDDRRAWKALVLVLVLRQEWDEAFAALSQAREHLGRLPAFDRWAALLRETELPTSGAPDVRVAQVGKLLLRFGEPALARRWMESALATWSDSLGLLLALLHTQIELERFDDALGLLTRIEALEPGQMPRWRGVREQVAQARIEVQRRAAVEKGL